MNLLFIDVETGGTDPNKHEILEIGCEYYIDNKLYSVFEVTLESEHESLINLKALKINKYNIQEDHVDRAEAIKMFVDYLLSLPSETPIVIAGHRTQFDINFFKIALAEFGYEGWDDLFSKDIIDTAQLANFLKAAGIINFNKLNLENLAICLKIKYNKEDLHKALADCSLTSSCYFKMLNLLKELNNG